MSTENDELNWMEEVMRKGKERVRRIDSEKRKERRRKRKEMKHERKKRKKTSIEPDSQI